MSLLNSTKNTRSIIENSLRYIRSDVPASLTDKEREWLLHNDIKTVVDLREEKERYLKPCVLENDSEFRYITLPVTGGNVVPKSTAEVTLSYINMVDDTMEEIVSTIINADTNVIYFCNAGKDRTGVVSAIILSKLGYDEKYIIDDYLISGENLKNDLDSYAQSIPEIDINVITPRAEYMKEFLEWLNVKYF